MKTSFSALAIKAIYYSNNCVFAFFFISLLAWESESPINWWYFLLVKFLEVCACAACGFIWHWLRKMYPITLNVTDNDENDEV